MGESKRKWSVREEDEGESQAAGMREKRLRQKNIESHTNIEVGVASLNWLQSNQ